MVSTDFAAWARGFVDERRGASCGERIALLALTGSGWVRIAEGHDLDDLVRYPVDRLALVPSTYGGMVVTALPAGRMRLVCADLDGAVAVLEGHADAGGAAGLLEMPAVDHEVLALLWLLMDVQATRPSVVELAARLITWGWLASPAREEAWARPGVVGDEGLARLGAGDIAGFARLVGVEMPATLDAERLRALAASLGHPSLDWDALPWVVTEDQRLDFLHACLPTRWALADELRTCDGRSDLAELVMSAPTPSRWAPAN